MSSSVSPPPRKFSVMSSQNRYQQQKSMIKKEESEESLEWVPFDGKSQIKEESELSQSGQSGGIPARRVTINLQGQESRKSSILDSNKSLEYIDEKPQKALTLKSSRVSKDEDSTQVHTMSKRTLNVSREDLAKIERQKQEEVLKSVDLAKKTKKNLNVIMRSVERQFKGSKWLESTEPQREEE